MVSSGAVSCESHWFLFPSRVWFGESEREEEKVKMGWPWGRPEAPLELALPSIMFPANEFLWTGLSLNQIGQGLRLSPSDILSIQGLIWQRLCLCHINPLRLLIMILVYRLHLWLSSLYISVCSLKSLWREPCLVILFSPSLCILERLAMLEKPSTTILTTFLLVSRGWNASPLQGLWVWVWATKWVNS